MRELKDNVGNYTKAVEVFLRARKKQGLRHRPASASGIDNLLVEAAHSLVSAVDNLTDTGRPFHSRGVKNPKIGPPAK